MSVSIVMPARNAEATIEESIYSVLANRLVSQLIIVDDKSSDRTPTIVSGMNDPRVEILLGEGNGISAALNLGMAAAKCDFLARCDSDDFYPHDRIDRQHEWLLQNPDFIAISGGFRTITDAKKSIADLACEGQAREVTDQLLQGVPITHFCTWLTRRSAVQSVGGARNWFVTAEDLDLMFRLAGEGRVWHEPSVAYLYRLHDSSVTHSQPNSQRRFYEQSAKEFARLRSKGEPDPLMQGNPPIVPQASEESGLSAKVQARNQLIGAAWSAHAAGHKIRGIRHLARGLVMQPLSLLLWRHLARIIMKRT